MRAALAAPTAAPSGGGRVEGVAVDGASAAEKFPHRLYHVAPRQLSILDAMAKPPRIDAKHVKAVFATNISSGSPSVKWPFIYVIRQPMIANVPV